MFCDNTLWGLINFRGDVIDYFKRHGAEVVLVAPEKEDEQMRISIPTGVKYIPVEGASGRAVATNLGDSPTNYLEWADVFSLKGGKYRISVRFSSPEAVDFDLVVNGKAHHASVATTDSAFVEIPFEVEFLKGENDVRISGVTSSKVALDCLKVTKL